MRKLRFLLIGCGRISKNHIAAAAANPESTASCARCAIPVDGARASKRPRTAGRIDREAARLFMTDYQQARSRKWR